MSNIETWREIEAACRGADAHFLRQCSRARDVQLALLDELIARNRETRFGRDHGFARIGSYRDYQAAVPIAPYEAFLPYVERLLAGEPDQLTAERVEFVETTGGSTSGVKIIPFTASASDKYWKAMQPWLAGLIARRPNLAKGRIYFSLSPAGRTGREKIGAIRLGSPQGLAYFGASGRHLAALSIVPPGLGALTDFETWSFATCLHLLAAGDLGFIWVWSPTFLTELLRAMQRMAPRLIDGLERGVDGPAELRALLPAPDPARAAQVREAWRDDGIDTGRLWPVLDTISCWMDASSAPFAAELQRLFPHSWFQAKGLMATEGAITVPFGKGAGAPLAVESSFVEFVDASGVAHLADDIAPGATYRVVTSNASGFYRYDTGDMVEVVGFTEGAPRLVFRGRGGLQTDLCGEKLSDDFVLRCLAEVFGSGGAVGFLAPSSRPHPHYVLCVDCRGQGADDGTWQARMETALARNPQYLYARNLGQLSELEILAGDGLLDRYQRWAVAGGRILGALKAPGLLPDFPASLRTALTPA